MGPTPYVSRLGKLFHSLVHFVDENVKKLKPPALNIKFYEWDLSHRSTPFLTVFTVHENYTN